MRQKRPATSLHAAAAAVVLGLGAAAAVPPLPGAPPAAAPTTQPTPAEARDAPLAPFRAELLALAFDTASAIPVDPHIKTRSRAQAAVVDACLQLDQPVRARRYVQQIDNWLRRAGYADLGAYLARRGFTAEAQQCLELATHLDGGLADWRRDNVLVRIARARALLGQAEQAAELEDGVVESEAGKVAGVRAELAGDEAFQRQVEALDALIAPGNFDVLRNALDSYTQLYQRVYDDPARRDLVKHKVTGAWGPLPIFIRIDLALAMAAGALEHGDRAGSLALVDEAQDLFNGAQWPLEYQVPIAGRLAAARFKAGDTSRARADADAVLASYDQRGQEQIVNMYRADALRPLAEAYQAMGDPAAALAVYRRAVGEGVANINSRPRAEDLAATCVSMAVGGAEPDAALWDRMRDIRQGLGPPW